jgi:hypothetical protein
MPASCAGRSSRVTPVVDGRFVAGYFYTKELQAAPGSTPAAPERASIQA